MNMALMRSGKDQGMYVHMQLFHFLTKMRRFQNICLCQGKLRIFDAYLEVFRMKDFISKIVSLQFVSHIPECI